MPDSVHALHARMAGDEWEEMMTHPDLGAFLQALVRATGGLADTVVNYSPAALADGSANGFVCQAATAEAILGTAGLATLVWQDKARWRQLQRNGMAGDFRWTGPARQYLDLYESLRPA